MFGWKTRSHQHDHRAEVRRLRAATFRKRGGAPGTGAVQGERRDRAGRRQGLRPARIAVLGTLHRAQRQRVTGAAAAALAMLVVAVVGGSEADCVVQMHVGTGLDAMMIMMTIMATVMGVPAPGVVIGKNGRIHRAGGAGGEARTDDQYGDEGSNQVV